MKQAALAATLLLSACATPPELAQAQQSSTCRPAGYDRAQLNALKAAEWALPDDAQRNALALALTACLGDADPAVRDGLAYEGLQAWMRGRTLTQETLTALNDDLQAKLTAPDGQGLQRPFAALVLSEVARTDRVAAWLTPAQRTQLIGAATAYVSGVRDYRGYDEREGWRHGVAHGADVLMQLSLNPVLDKAQLTQIVDSVLSQVAPDGHFYIYGESERLARPILFAAQRGLISEEEWTAWFARVPALIDEPFTTQAGLAQRHNVNAFLQTVWLNAKISESTADDVLLPGAEAAMRAG
jgi:hypothetical protein